jgi:hypothetical protein
MLKQVIGYHKVLGLIRDSDKPFRIVDNVDSCQGITGQLWIVLAQFCDRQAVDVADPGSAAKAPISIPSPARQASAKNSRKRSAAGSK